MSFVHARMKDGLGGGPVNDVISLRCVTARKEDCVCSGPYIYTQVMRLMWDQASGRLDVALLHAVIRCQAEVDEVVSRWRYGRLAKQGRQHACGARSRMCKSIDEFRLLRK